SIQTLAQPRRLERLTPDFRTIVVDEAHHAAAASYRRVLDHLGAFEPRDLLTLGVTATPTRGDRIGPDDIFEVIVYNRPILDMIESGYLADLRAIQVHLEADLDALRVRGGDFADDELGDALLEANAPEHAAAAYCEHAAGRKALIFTPTVSLAYAM